MLHHLKTWPQYFRAVQNGSKPFEIRNNADRDFQVGDFVTLHEWDPSVNRYVGPKITQMITYVTNYEQKPGFVVFGMTSAVMAKQDEMAL